MVRIRDLPEARNFDIGADEVSFDAKFFVWEATNEVDVQNAVQIHTPPIYLQMIRRSIRANEVGPGMWMVTVPYATIDANEGILQPGTSPSYPNPQEPHAPLNGANGFKWSFDTVGESTHITQSLLTVSKSTNASSLATPDNSNAIGVSADRVEGCDIHGKKFEFTIDVPYKEVSMAYIIGLYHLTGTVNYKQRVLGFQKGELLYLGATGSFTFENRWTLTHRFAAKPNEEEVKVSGALLATDGTIGTPVAGGSITIPKVRGWDYVWFEYVTAKVGNRMLQLPSAAYVEEVYNTGDFSIIPGGPEKLKQILGADGEGPGFFADMSEKIRKKIRFRHTQQVIGTVVEFKWSDPNLPP